MGKQGVIFIIFLGMMKICVGASPFNSSTDALSLVAIKAHVSSDPNNILTTNWSQGTDFCTWIGIICSRRRPRVTVLDLFNMSLQGTIASDIGNLSFLTYLSISNNSFNGSIPDEIGNLRRLRVLQMSFNQLSGKIPLSLKLLNNLERLTLEGNHLTGTIPWSTFNFPSLRVIGLTQNDLSGTLPVDMCHRLPKLEGLFLSYNHLSGDIPTSLTACSELNTLSLSYNNFIGSIPMQIGNSSQLQRLSFSTNELTGTIPPSIGNLSSLEILDLSDNNLQGEIPIEMGLLSNLTFLSLEMNELNGKTPQSIFNLSSLELLSLVGNELSGNLPFSINRGLPNLQWLYLGSNRFNGGIPNSITNLTKLNLLDLSTNSFSGLIPITLGDLHNLEILYLHSNQLTNNLSIPGQDFVTSLAKCSYLKVTWISRNPITGLLPISIGLGNLSTSLEIFDVSSCRISGEIPNEIGNMSSLISLGLANNELTGMIPWTLEQLRNLQRFEINDNKLSGSIPQSFCNLKNMYYANLVSNRIFGQLPSCIGNLISLRELYLAYNAFNSYIPSTLWSNVRLQIINVSNNFFDGSLSHEIGKLNGLSVLDLSGNQFSGEIPSTFGQLPSLNRLSLSNNKLQGPIPESFDNLKGLLYLDLSHNNLSGEITKALETLTDLSYFNVSFNELSGEIPDGGPFINFTAEFFIGNKGLCGASRFKVKVCKRNTRKSSMKSIFIRYILPPITFIIFASIIVMLLLRYHVRKSPVSTMPVGVSFERMSYLELLRATNNFDEENLIGRGSLGSVYKGIFSNGNLAAIKVFDLDVQGAFKSFDIECHIMRSLRHRNLVKVITSCSNLDFKALVLEYMPRGSLEKLLYSPNYSLNFIQRLGIMIDVGSAIEYLHQGYSSPIVHCDLKPSNILLNEDMVAHVGDFGIAKLLSEDQRMKQTKTLGTIGYMAPEYGSAGLVSTSVDVYSYGILLMETFTLKKPTDEIFLGELTLRSWVFDSLTNDLMKIVDVDLLNVDGENMRAKTEKCFTSIMGLALECTVDLPEERLNIKDVLIKLQNMKTEVQ
ncbi:hypothetical protein RD792_006290 [Penstemon davidsonii]|uniref:Protein kinase domain-containing protein n=1 Tax=Penstemon davidsonii TaxID=160366 RepID=A0ABR0DCJ0_9LAMI|nr:hypothetical protein RD792_006290 [Penstemon davidsonii]